MAEVQNVEGEAEVEAINTESRMIFDKLNFYKFTKSWGFDVLPDGRDHEFASPMIRTRPKDNKFNFAWRLVYSKVNREDTLSISLLSFDKRHLDVCVRCYFEDESFGVERLAEERAFDFSSQAPIQKTFTLESMILDRICKQKMHAIMLQIQNPSSVRNRVHVVIRVDFEFLEPDQHLQSESSKLSDDLELLTKRNDVPTDVTFQIGEKELKAHKCILAARSPVFAKMFEGQETQDNRYSIDDIEADVFQLLLTFVYCGKTTEARNANKLTELRLAAEKFGLTL